MNWQINIHLLYAIREYTARCKLYRADVQIYGCRLALAITAAVGAHEVYGDV